MKNFGILWELRSKYCDFLLEIDIVFLSLLMLNMFTIDPASATRFDITWHEYVLWVWVVASLMEEVSQYIADSSNSFYLASYVSF